MSSILCDFLVPTGSCPFYHRRFSVHAEDLTYLLKTMILSFQATSHNHTINCNTADKRRESEWDDLREICYSWYQARLLKGTIIQTFRLSVEPYRMG